MKKWLLQSLIAFDQLVNALLGGWADETLSSRTYRLSYKGLPWSLMRALIDLVFFWDPDHCRASYESEQERRHLPPQLRP